MIHNASKLVGFFIRGKSSIEIKQIYEQILQVDKEIEKLRLSFKKDTPINRRIELNVELKKLEAKRARLLMECS
jgi:hypothetical protein